MEVRKLYSNGSAILISIPSTYIRQFGWKPGDYVVLRVLDQGVLTINHVSQENKLVANAAKLTK